MGGMGGASSSSSSLSCELIIVAAEMKLQLVNLKQFHAPNYIKTKNKHKHT